MGGTPKTGHNKGRLLAGHVTPEKYEAVKAVMKTSDADIVRKGVNALLGLEELMKAAIESVSLEEVSDKIIAMVAKVRE